jgi:hypothetical protein
MKKEDDFGTETDGSKSKDYCKFCYQDGSFLDGGISLEDKIERLVKIGVENLGMSEEQARKMAEGKLPGLKRWKR